MTDWRDISSAPYMQPERTEAEKVFDVLLGDAVAQLKAAANKANLLWGSSVCWRTTFDEDTSTLRIEFFPEPPADD